MNMTTHGKLISSQSWKLWLGFGVLAIAGVFLFVPLQQSLVIEGFAWPTKLLGTGIGLIAFLWLTLAVVCPRCKLRLFWHAVSTKHTSNWLGWLLDASSCPRCGYEPSSHAQGSNK